MHAFVAQIEIEMLASTVGGDLLGHGGHHLDGGGCRSRTLARRP